MNHFDLIRDISTLELAVDEVERSGKGWKEVWGQIKLIGRFDTKILQLQAEFEQHYFLRTT